MKIQPKLDYIVILAAFLTAVVAAHAQISTDDDARDRAAIAKITGERVDEAAELLGAHATTARGSVAWYQQSAFELVKRAYIFQATLDYEGKQAAAAAAVKLLERGLTSQKGAIRAPERAHTYVQLAKIYEGLLGDLETARLYYEQAAEAEPQNAVAKKSAERLKDADANFRRQVLGKE
jgi:hypothetical protein